MNLKGFVYNPARKEDKCTAQKIKNTDPIGLYYETNIFGKKISREGIQGDLSLSQVKSTGVTSHTQLWHACDFRSGKCHRRTKQHFDKD